MSTLNERGQEVVDSRPMSVPAGFKKPESLAEQIRRMVRAELSQAATSQGFETFEEADDFEVDDDYDPRSPWELDFDPVPDRKGSAEADGAAAGADGPKSDGSTGSGGGASSAVATVQTASGQDISGPGTAPASKQTPS